MHRYPRTAHPRPPVWLFKTSGWKAVTAENLPYGKTRKHFQHEANSTRMLKTEAGRVSFHGQEQKAVSSKWTPRKAKTKGGKGKAKIKHEKDNTT